MITHHEIQDAIERVVLHRLEGTDSVVCALVLRNGHVVVGEAHCAPGTTFDPAMGAGVARHDAESKLASLLAYSKREFLYQP